MSPTLNSLDITLERTTAGVSQNSRRYALANPSCGLGRFPTGLRVAELESVSQEAIATFRRVRLGRSGCVDCERVPSDIDR